MKKSAFNDAYPKSWVGKNIIYNIMTSHYRRIHNVKSKVETNLFSGRQKQLNISQNSQENNIKESRSLKTFNHHSRRSRCENMTQEKEFQINVSSKMKDKSKEIGDKIHFDMTQAGRHYRIDMNRKISGNCTFHPQILSTNVESKLKNSLDVYHPPKKHLVSSLPDLKQRKENEFPRLSFMDTGQQESPNTAKPSSLDSAYTEGLDDQWSEAQLTPQISGNGARFRNIVKNGPSNENCYCFRRELGNCLLDSEIYSRCGIKNLFKENARRKKYEFCRKIMESALKEIEMALEIPTDDELTDMELNLGNCSANHCLGGSHSYLFSLNDNYVLTALESLHLDPKLKEEVKKTLGLNKYQDMKCEKDITNNIPKTVSDTEESVTSISSRKKDLSNSQNISQKHQVLAQSGEPQESQIGTQGTYSKTAQFPGNCIGSKESEADRIDDSADSSIENSLQSHNFDKTVTGTSASCNEPVEHLEEERRSSSSSLSSLAFD